MRGGNLDPREEPEKLACAMSANAVAFIQGELLPETAARFVRHLDECAHCRDEVRGASEVLGRLAALPEPSEEIDLAPRVMTAFARALATESARRTRRLRALSGAVAALVLAAAALAWLRVPGRTNAPAEPAPPPAAPAAPATVGTSAGATADALLWLARAQEPSGAWSASRWGGRPEYDIALTGLALLALLNDATEAAPTEGRDAATPRAARERARAYLLSTQGSDGRFGPEFAAAPYNHSIAAVALIESFGCSPEESLRAPIDRALAYICATQSPAGGWGYLGSPGEEPNTALTCWPLQALVLARALGRPGLDDAVRGGFAHLARVADARGRLGYRRAGDFLYGEDTLAPMGALCVLLARDASPLPRDVRARLLDTVMLAGVARKNGGDLYRDFFLTAALEALPPGRGARVPEDALRALAARQVRAGAERGSWEPRDRWGSAGGRVYVTSVAALILTAGERAERLSRWAARS